MKLEWDEIAAITSFVMKHRTEWETHLIGSAFDSETLLTKLCYMTTDEERKYVERFGPRTPRGTTSIMEVQKGEKVFHIDLEMVEGKWTIQRVPGFLAFVLLATTLEGAQERLARNGWKFSFPKTQ